MPGLTVELTDSSGDVLATTKTDFRGQYTFTQQSGPSANPEIAAGVSATGDYDVVLVLPSFLKQTSADPGTITITHGGQNVTGVNFTVAFVRNDGSTGAAPAAADKATIAVPSDGGGAPASAIIAAQSAGNAAPTGGATASTTGGGAGSAVHAAMVPASSPASATPGADVLTPLGAVDPETSTAGDPLAGVFQDDPDAV